MLPAIIMVLDWCTFSIMIPSWIGSFIFLKSIWKMIFSNKLLCYTNWTLRLHKETGVNQIIRVNVWLKKKKKKALTAILWLKMISCSPNYSIWMSTFIHHKIIYLLSCRMATKNLDWNSSDYFSCVLCSFEYGPCLSFFLVVRGFRTGLLKRCFTEIWNNLFNFTFMCK